MRNFTVRLTKLDREMAVTHANTVPVYINDQINNPIGTCRVYKNQNSEFIGEVQLNTDVSGDLYFYYVDNVGAVDAESGYHFSGLHFTDDMLKDKPTQRLKEKVIN